MSKRSTAKRLSTLSLRAGVALGALLASGAQAAPDCMLSGSASIFNCGTDYIQARGLGGASGLTVTDTNTASVELRLDPTITDEDGPFQQTLTITGNSVIDRPDYAAVVMYTSVAQRDATVILDEDVQIFSRGGDIGAVWIRNETSGDISINSAALVTAFAGAGDGITATTNLGAVTLTNSGFVTSVDGRGLYADGGYNNAPEDPVEVSITNTGTVNAYQAGIRAIDYQGHSKADNQGTVDSTTRQAVVAYSANGPATILNSGTATSHDDSALYAAAETGTVTVTNSGTVTAADDPGIVAARDGYSGIRAITYTSGNVFVTNEEEGSITALDTSGTAADDAAIFAYTPSGSVTIVNDGSVHGRFAVSGISDDGSVSLTNSATIEGDEGGVYLDGATNSLTNSGSITAAAGTAVSTGDGNSTITTSGSISAASSTDTAIAFGSGNDRLVLQSGASITGIANAGTGTDTLEIATPSSRSFDASLIGSASQYRGFETILKSGAGTLTLNFGSGGGSTAQNWNVTGGTLVGSASSLGQADVLIGATATLNMAQSGTGTFSGSLSGTGSFIKSSTGVLTMSGDSGDFDGATQVTGGRLRVTGSLGGTVQVASGATLAGTGNVGAVTIASGATLAGQSGQTLGMASLTMNSGAKMAVTLGAPTTTQLFDVTGNLVLNGTVSVTAGSDFGPGVYRLISYGGTLSGSGLTIDPASTVTDGLQIQTSVAGKVNLLAEGETTGGGDGGTPGGTFAFWDGGDTAKFGNGAIDGGAGRWTATSTSWTTADGATNGALPAAAFAIFDGTGGAVQTDASAGALSVSGMQFATGGYSVTGDGIALTGSSATIRVGDGTSAGAGYTATIGAALTGDAKLVKTDLGTLVLTGGNSYTGGTQVDAGTLQGNSSSIRGNLLNKAMVVFDQGSSGEFAGAISGMGETVKQGAGTLTLSGDSSSYTGHTTISQGSVNLTGALGGSVAIQANGAFQVGDGGDLSASLRNDGTLTFARSGAYAYGGALSGSGTTLKQGTGTLTLSGDSGGYTGGTTISQGSILLTGALGGSVEVQANGTLQVGNGDTSGDLTASTRNDGTLIFARSDDYDYTGALSGTGALIKRGDGLLLLSGDYSYTGSTVVEGGAVRLASALNPETNLVVNDGDFDLGNRDQTVAGLEGSSGSVTLGTGNLVVDQSTDSSFGGSIQGSGSFTKTGSGTLNLTGTSSFTGQAIVSGGRLAVNGTLPGTVSVGSTGVIGGNGTIGRLVVQNGGAAAPGNSIGLLHVSGNVTFEAGSAYQVEINAAGQGDSIAATGTATIQGGTVNVLAAQGDYAPLTSYTVLTADAGVSGTFAGVDTNLAFLTPSLSYEARAVTLQVLRNDISFADVAVTANQRAAATATEQLGMTDPIYGAIVRSTADGARQGFDQLSGELHAATRTMLVQDANRPREAILSRLDTEAPSGVWVQGVGSWIDNDGNGNAGRLSYSTTGLLMGIDHKLGDMLRLGLAGGYTHSSGDVLNRASHATVDSGHVMAYLAGSSGALHFSAGGGYSWSDVDTRRSISIGTFGDTLNASYKGNVLQGFARVGYELPLGGGTLEPFGALAVMREHVDGLAERGGAAALSADSDSRTVSFSTLGLKAETPLVDGAWSIRAQGGWEHGFGDLSPSRTVRFASGPQMLVEGAALSRNAAVVESAIVWRPIARLAASIGYSGRLGNSGQDHGVRASLVLGF